MIGKTLEVLVAGGIAAAIIATTGDQDTSTYYIQTLAKSGGIGLVSAAFTYVTSALQGGLPVHGKVGLSALISTAITGTLAAYGKI